MVIATVNKRRSRGNENQRHQKIWRSTPGTVVVLWYHFDIGHDGPGTVSLEPGSISKRTTRTRTAGTNRTRASGATAAGWVVRSVWQLSREARQSGWLVRSVW